MIDLNSIQLDLDYIFADVSTNEAFLICLPVCDAGSETLDLGAFFKNIMFATQFDQSENCDYVAKIINFLNGSPVFSLHEFRELLQELKHTAAYEKHSKVEERVKAPVAKSISESKAEPPVRPQPKIVPQAPVKTEQKPVQRPVEVPVQEQVQVPEGKKISMMYLLRNYSKENAAAYKAQQAAKKAAANAESSGQKAVKPDKQAKKGKERKQQPAGGFAIPGQEGQPVAAVAPVVPQPAASEAPPAAVQKPQPAAAGPEVPKFYEPAQIPQGQNRNFGETVCLSGGASLGTTVLGVPQGQKQQPYLVRTKNNEKIVLNKPMFRIGKESTYVDYFVGDNPAVSRSHACFVSRGEEVFVMDTNSTNHTFVNGERLQSNTEFKLDHGDHVRLGNEEFEFRVY